LIGKHLSVTEKSAWARVVSLCRQEKRWFVSSLLLTLGSTFLDVGALSIFGLAISLLIGDAASFADAIPEWVVENLSGHFGAIDSRATFFFLIGLAVFLQLLKSGLGFAVIAVDAIFRANIQKHQVLTVSQMVLNARLGTIREYSVGAFTALGGQVIGYVRLCRVLQETATCIVTMLIYFGASVLLNSGLALAIVGFTAIVFLVGRVIAIKVKHNQTLVAKLQIDLSKQMTEYYAATKMLQLYNVTKAAVSEIHELSKDIVDRGTKVAIANATMNPILEILVVALVAGFLILLVIGGYDKVDTFSEMFVVVLLFFRMKPYLTRLGAQKVKIANALPLAANVELFLARSVIDQPKREQNSVKKRQRNVEIKKINQGVSLSKVSFGYDACNKVVRDVDLELRRGEIVGLVGASGSGKSTVLSMLSGILEPQSGRVDVDGKDLREIDLTSWRRLLGIVDPDLPLLNRTVSENIAFGLGGASEEMIRTAASLAGASDFIGGLEQGYDTVVGDRGEQLSLGQRQRLALARALVRDPELLILDEATSGLDAESERDILKSVFRHRKRGAVIIATHKLATILNVDRVYVLANGSVVQVGSATELSRMAGPFAEAWSASNAEIT